MTSTPDQPSPIHLLVVDDDHGDTLLIEEALRTHAPTIGAHIVHDGWTALAFLRRQPPYHETPRPRLVLLDIHMPRRNGLDVLADIKTDPDLATIPVVMFSASTAPHHITASYDLRANAYVVKPATADQFFTTVNQIVHFYTETAITPAETKSG